MIQLCDSIQTPTRIFLFIVGCTVLSSCSSSDAPATSAGKADTFPAEFEEDGTKWTKSDTIENSDLVQLSGYFKKNSSLAEGPIVSGDPTLYTSPKGGKRFYWGRSAAESSEWMYIQFAGRKATVEEGTGEPLRPSTT